jgi:hypothetical protein
MVLLSRSDKAKPQSPFKRMYTAARQGQNDWLPVFLPWQARPDRDAAWYESQRRDVLARTGSLDDLAEQYPATDAEALAPRVLDKRIPADWLQQCFVEQAPLALPPEAPAIPGLSLFAWPQPGHRYVIGADPAEGNPTSDDSALCVLDVNSGAQVAELAGKFEPSVFASYAYQLAVWFYKAGILVERNNHGHTVLLWIRACGSDVRALHGHDDKPGWLSSTLGKTQLYDTCADDEIRRIIREEEPPKPSTRFSTLGQAAATASADRRSDPRRLSQLIRGELDWIVLKALEKDRNRRYESASAFAADVQCYLHDEPVQACPPSLAYRLRKFVHRHRGPVLAASLIFLALVGGIIGTTWGMIRATDARGVALHETQQKQAALAAAQQSERNAKDQLFLALLHQARAVRFSRQMGQRLDSLAAVAEAARLRPDERLRDEAIAALALPDIRRVPCWRSVPPGTATIPYGGLYRLYVHGDPQGILSIRSIPDDRVGVPARKATV